MVSHDWWVTLFFTLSGHMTCQNASVCQPRQRQRSFWGSLENNNATSICKDNETNGRGCFQPGAIICWGCLHHNNWGSCSGRNSRPKCKRLIMLPFPATSPGKMKKMYEWMEMHKYVKTYTCVSHRRFFSRTECWKGDFISWRSPVQSWTPVVKCLSRTLKTGALSCCQTARWFWLNDPKLCLLASSCICLKIVSPHVCYMAYLYAKEKDMRQSSLLLRSSQSEEEDVRQPDESEEGEINDAVCHSSATTSM